MKSENVSTEVLQTDPKCEILDDPVTWMFWKSRRYLVVFLAFFGFFNLYTLRINLSIAIVAMTELRNVTLANGTIVAEQYFDWDSNLQGLVLASFFYGYVLTQLIGGYLANKLGGHLVFAVGIGGTAVLSLVSPAAANINVYLFIAVRVLKGIFEGVTFPCIHQLWSRWAPPLERSRMASIAFAGTYAGTVVVLPVSGLLAESWGWESIFYVFGAIGCIWFIVFVYIVKDGPEHDSRISEREKNYILNSLNHDEDDAEKPPIPWKAIFTSTAVWAIVICHFTANWGFYTLLTYLPTFLNDTLGFELGETGILSAVPYIVLGLLLVVAGYLADWFQIKGYLTTTQVRKYFNCGSFFGQALFMILGAYFLDRFWTLFFIALAAGSGAFTWSGFIVNHLDIAPQYASILMGISNTFGTIPGMISPSLTGYIIQTSSPSEWQTVFYITAGFYCIGCLFWWFFCTGDVQSWAITEKPKSKETFDQSQEAIEIKNELK